MMPDDKCRLTIADYFGALNRPSQPLEPTEFRSIEAPMPLVPPTPGNVFGPLMTDYMRDPLREGYAEDEY